VPDNPYRESSAPKPPPYSCPCCGYVGLDYPAYAKTTGFPIEVTGEPPYLLTLGDPSYGVCPCCGFEFGNDDDPGGNIPGSTFSEYLGAWIAEGSAWFDAKKRPEGWDLREQLRRGCIPYPDPSLIVRAARPAPTRPAGWSLARDGLSLQLVDSDKGIRAIVFRCDDDNTVLVEYSDHGEAPPPDVLEWFYASALRALNPFWDGTPLPDPDHWTGQSAKHPLRR
jgi:hypothetical protein